MKEIWKDVQGYDGYYQVSDLGRIKSYHNHQTGKILKPHKNRKGYLRVQLYKNGTKKRMRVHKVVLLSFVGDAPKGMQINHKNGIKDDNRLDNLEYVTPAYNMKHAFDNGFLGHKVGIDVNGAILDCQKVRTMRKIHETGQHSFWEIGKRFGVAKRTASDAINRKTWRHCL